MFENQFRYSKIKYLGHKPVKLQTDGAKSSEGYHILTDDIFFLKRKKKKLEKKASLGF